MSSQLGRTSEVDTAKPVKADGRSDSQSIYREGIKWITHAYVSFKLSRFRGGAGDRARLRCGDGPTRSSGAPSAVRVFALEPRAAP